MTDNKPIISSYLSFKLGNETFAVNVNNTVKILQLSEITKIPNAPINMKGVINHHGNIIPIMDLNQTLSLPETEYGKNTCILILTVNKNNQQIYIGAIVDEVLNVEKITDEQISAPPSLGNKNTMDSISGVYKKDENFTMILSINAIFKEIILENQNN